MQTLMPTSVEKLLRGRDMLCFSHDWTGDPLSKTHLMRVLAKDNRILWINSIGYRTPTVCKRDLTRAWRKLTAVFEPIREVEPNLFVLNPLALPIYNSIGQKINRRLLQRQVRAAMRRLNFHRPINWIFNPAAAVIAGTLDEDFLIYYCVDEYAAFSGVSRSHIALMEHRLLRDADLVVVSADNLFASKAAANPNTILIRHGVDYDHFRRALDPATQSHLDLACLPRPIIGYFGLIAQDWVDLPLLDALAKRFPKASLVLLGKVTMDISSLQRYPNVHLLGRKPYADLPAYSKGFDVAIIPFPISEVTLNANPLKAREYLAAGLPVVSTAIPEVRHLPHCRVANDPTQFCDEIIAALHDPAPREVRSKSMETETWAARVDDIRRHLAGTRTQGDPISTRSLIHP